MRRRVFLKASGLGLASSAIIYGLRGRLIDGSRQNGGATHSEQHDLVQPRFTNEDQLLFTAGKHYRIYEKLGSHPYAAHNSVTGVYFAVWAPGARRVSVVGSFNDWDERRHPMNRHAGTGVWECFVAGASEGDLYKYSIVTDDGSTVFKADPYAFFAEVRPATASIVCQIDGVYPWRDQQWMERRPATRIWERPISIYEVHLGSWRRQPNGEYLTYREMATTLVPYVKALGFTHIELLPIAEYPFDPSWGYQVSGYYAPTSRFGRPEELMAFVDECHQYDIGVLLDWVPGHFSKDLHGLGSFDGNSLYEYADRRQSEHPDWGTLCFDLGRPEVRSFLIANALFWIEHYHFDGLRVDAVASILYLDYSRPNPKDWTPNKNGGAQNLEAIDFLKQLNIVVHGRFPGVMMVAEESSAWPQVSRHTDEGGLGFGFKWNIGWMHEVLDYMRAPPEQRRLKHNKIVFSVTYAFGENFVLPFSHDEVVHGKHSLINKMPGDETAKFANLRLLYTFMYGYPGKKLLFMGAEFGQSAEWDAAGSLAWDQTADVLRTGLLHLVRDLNRLYLYDRALYEADFESLGFEWLESDNAEQSFFVFLRRVKNAEHVLMFALNFSAMPLKNHRIYLPSTAEPEVILNSDATIYGGSGRFDASQHLRSKKDCGGSWITLWLPPLTGLILRQIDSDLHVSAAHGPAPCR